MKLMEFLSTYRITNKEFAQHIGIDPAVVWKLCKEKQIPAIPLANKIMQATSGKVTYDDFYTPEEEILPIISEEVATSREMYNKLKTIESNYQNQIEELQKQIGQLQEYVTSTSSVEKAS